MPHPLLRVAFTLLAFILALGLTACPAPTDRPAEVDAPTDREDGTVPLRFVGPGDAALVVDVYINGEGPYDFVLDTGATFTCVTEDIAEQLQLPERRRPAMGSTPGGTGTMVIVDVDSVRVGQASATGLGACVLDLNHIAAQGIPVQGLLGLNFLRAFHVTLDFEQEILTLEQPR